MNRTSIDEWNELAEMYSDSAHKMNKQFRDKWDEIASVPSAKAPAEQIIADLYVNVPAECSEMRTSILLGSDILGAYVHFKEMPEESGKERPALHLTCPYCVYQQGNPGWHKVVLSRYTAGKQPVTEEILWHSNSLKHRSGLLAKIREMAKQLADGMPEY